MKKSFLLLAAAALTLVACNKTVTIAENEGDAISFRPVLSGITKTANAAGLKTSFESGDIMNVYADYNSGKYFQADFTSNGTGFNSPQPYYWPTDVSTKNVTFTAIWGATQKADNPGQIDNYSPDAAAANQRDILLAKHVSSTKEAPVLLNFRHALSQIVVKVKNSNANLKVTITGVRVGYVKTASSNFTYSGGVTDTRQTLTNGSITDGVTPIPLGNWTLVDFAASPTTTTANDYKYDQASSLILTGQVDSGQEFASGFTSWILLPQNLTTGSGYATTKNGTKGTANPDLNGAYLALNMQIENYNGTAATGTIVATQWCYWPISGTWNPGYKYTYVIDVAGGGYEPEDTDNDGALDPVLDGAIIVISPSCTIDEWIVADDVAVSN